MTSQTLQKCQIHIFEKWPRTTSEEAMEFDNVDVAEEVCILVEPLKNAPFYEFKALKLNDLQQPQRSGRLTLYSL